MPLHWAACYSKSVAVVQALITANPEAAKAKDNVRRPSPPSLAAPRASLTPYLVAPPSPITIHVQSGNMPLHWAACHSTSVAVVQALLTANPEAARAKDNVRRPSPPSLAAPRASEAPQRVLRGSSEAHQAIRG